MQHPGSLEQLSGCFQYRQFSESGVRQQERNVGTLFTFSGLISTVSSCTETENGFIPYSFKSQIIGNLQILILLTSDPGLVTTCVYSSALNFKEDILVGKLEEARSDDCFPQNIINQNIVFGLFYHFFFNHLVLNYLQKKFQILQALSGLRTLNLSLSNVWNTWTKKINKIKGIALQL